MSYITYTSEGRISKQTNAPYQHLFTTYKRLMEKPT